MKNITPQTRVFVYTYKQGLLSAIAHDLKIEATDFEVTREGDQLAARFDPAGLKVLCAMKRGSENPKALSDKDKAEIEENILKDVLHRDDHPSIEFESSALGSAKVEGTLKMHGQSKPIAIAFSQQGEEQVAEVEIDQRDFGIKPFKALAGTLKVKPTIKVQIRTTAV